MIISSILAVVVFAVMFIMAARDKLSRPAVMGMSAVGAVLLLFGVFIGLSRSDDQMLIAQIAAVLIFVVMFVLTYYGQNRAPHSDPLLRTRNACNGVRYLPQEL